MRTPRHIMDSEITGGYRKNQKDMVCNSLLNQIKAHHEVDPDIRLHRYPKNRPPRLSDSRRKNPKLFFYSQLF